MFSSIQNKSNLYNHLTHTESIQKKISWDCPFKSDTHAHFIDLSRCYVFWKEGRAAGRKGLSPPNNGGSPPSKHGIYLSSELRLSCFNIYPFPLYSFYACTVCSGAPLHWLHLRNFGSIILVKTFCHNLSHLGAQSFRNTLAFHSPLRDKDWRRILLCLDFVYNVLCRGGFV